MPNSTISTNVWRVWESARDCSDAERFGALLAPCFDKHKVSPHDVVKMQEIVRNEVLPFADRNDHILTVGPQIMVLVLSSLWFKHFGEARFLVWDATRNRYVSKHVGGL